MLRRRRVWSLASPPRHWTKSARHARLGLVSETVPVTVLWRGDPAQGDVDGTIPPRLEPVVVAFSEHGATVRALGFAEEYVSRARAACLASRAVVVWVDPLSGDRDRRVLDELLAECVAAGTRVYTDPNVVFAMGTKDVLYDTRELDWALDVDRYVSADELETRLVPRLRAGESRVLKPRRGNGGRGVWRVTPLRAGGDGDDLQVLMQHAALRDGSNEVVPLRECLDRLGAYVGAGPLIDQAFAEDVGTGMVRAYLVKDVVVGFARQYPVREDAAGQTLAAELTFAMASAKTMRSADDPEFAALRERLESEWVPALDRLVGVGFDRLPLLWDADFLFGAREPSGEVGYCLGEINVSCVTPFPPSAPEAMARVLMGELVAR